MYLKGGRNNPDCFCLFFQYGTPKAINDPNPIILKPHHPLKVKAGPSAASGNLKARTGPTGDRRQPYRPQPHPLPSIESRRPEKGRRWCSLVQLYCSRRSGKGGGRGRSGSAAIPAPAAAGPGPDVGEGLFCRALLGPSGPANTRTRTHKDK